MRLFLLMLLLSSCFCWSTGDSISPSLDEVLTRFGYAVRTLFVPDLSGRDCRACTPLDTASEQHGIKAPVLSNQQGIAENSDKNMDRNQSDNAAPPGQAINDPRHSLTNSVEEPLCIDDSLVCLTRILTDMSHPVALTDTVTCTDVLSYLKVTYIRVMSAVTSPCANQSSAISGVYAYIMNLLVMNEHRSDDTTNTHDSPSQPRQETVKSQSAGPSESYSTDVEHSRGKRWYHPSEWTVSSLFWKNEMHGPHMMVASLVSERRTVDKGHRMTAKNKRDINEKALDDLSSAVQSIWRYIRDGVGGMYAIALGLYNIIAIVLDDVYHLSGTDFPNWETQASLYNLLSEWTNIRFVWLQVMAGKLCKTALESWQSFLVFKNEILLIAMVCVWILDYLNHGQYQEQIARIDVIDTQTSMALISDHADKLNKNHSRCCRESSISLKENGDNSDFGSSELLLSEDNERHANDYGFYLLLIFDDSESDR